MVALSREIPLVHELALGAAAGRADSRLAGWLEAGYRLPARYQAEPIGVELSAAALRVGLAVGPRETRFVSFGIGAGIGVQRTGSRRSAAAASVMPATADAFWSATARLIRRDRVAHDRPSDRRRQARWRLRGSRRPLRPPRCRRRRPSRGDPVPSRAAASASASAGGFDPFCAPTTRAGHDFNAPSRLLWFVAFSLLALLVVGCGDSAHTLGTTGTGGSGGAAGAAGAAGGGARAEMEAGAAVAAEPRRRDRGRESRAAAARPASRGTRAAAAGAGAAAGSERSRGTRRRTGGAAGVGGAAGRGGTGGGTGGAGGAAGRGGRAAAAADGGAGGGAICGGSPGIPCAAGLVCDIDTPNRCGSGSVTGRCITLPDRLYGRLQSGLRMQRANLFERLRAANARGPTRPRRRLRRDQLRVV